MPPVRGGFAAENLFFTVLCDHFSRFSRMMIPVFFGAVMRTGISLLCLPWSLYSFGRSRDLGVSSPEGEKGWKDLAHFQAAEISRSESEDA
jgi:hypothetical protein